MRKKRITDKKLVKILRRIVRDHLWHPGSKPSTRCPKVLKSSLELANVLLAKCHSLSNKELASALRLAFATRALRIFSSAIHLHRKQFYVEQLGLLRSISELYALAVWLFLDTSKEKLRTVAWEVSGFRAFSLHIMLQTTYMLKFDQSARNRELYESNLRASGMWENRCVDLCKRFSIEKERKKVGERTKEIYKFTTAPPDNYLNPTINSENVDRSIVKFMGKVLGKRPALPQVTSGGTMLSLERLFPGRMDLWFHEHFGDLDNPIRSDGHLFRIESQFMHNDFPMSLALMRKQEQFEQYTYYIGALALHMLLLLTSVGKDRAITPHGYEIWEVADESQAVADHVGNLHRESLRIKNEWERSELESAT